MKLWRLTRAAHVALDGAGAALHGGRYSPPGIPVVPMASDAALAVLVAMRYLPFDRELWPTDHVLGWTETGALPERVPPGADDAMVMAHSTQWLAQSRSLLLALPSRVLPEGDVILLNPRHADAAAVAPLICRPFDFADALHRPPMLDRFADARG